MPIYNKLVRDLIPKIIMAEGKRCEVSQLVGEDLLAALEAKLIEETQEFMESDRDLEELADILEVVHALAVELGSSFEEILVLKESKRKERGGFKKGLWLEWVED